MTEYLQSSDEVLSAQKTTVGGLSTAEAAHRLEANGKNKLKEAKKESLLHKFLSELADPMIIILIVAAVISSVVEFYEASSAGTT